MKLFLYPADCKETIAAMKDICLQRYEAFGTAGNADKISALSLESMTSRYQSGELKQVVN